MTPSNTVAIVPLRFLPVSKHRLVNIMDHTSRKRLVGAMLVDVLRAIKSAKCIDRVVIVTPDDNILSGYSELVFERHKSQVLGLNLELNRFIAIMETQGVKNAIIILADLPLLTGEVLDELIRSGVQSKRPVIAQDWKGRGTNLFFFSLPSQIEFRFGEESFQKHMASCKAAGMIPIVYHSLETSLDIDDADALKKLLALAHLDERLQETETYRVLHGVEKSGKAA